MNDNYNPYDNQNNSTYSYNRDELNQRGVNNTYSYDKPPVASYSAYAENSYYTGKPPKKEKKTRKYPLSILVACCLICSLLGGTVAMGAMVVINENKFISPTTENSKSSNSSDPEKTIINVTNDQTEELITAVAQKASPSVVGIRATAKTYNFWGQVQDSGGEGSGIIYTTDGYIITNYHVISTAVESTTGKITVFLPSDPETALNASVVGYYRESDIAVIKIEKTGLPAIEVGDSSKLKIGQTAIAIGNPGGLQYMGSVSTGIVSGLDRTLKLEGIEEMSLIQTDAAINPGNSGGALVNTSGQLIGVNSSKIASTAVEGMGFAIPSNYVKELCDDIISKKDIKKAYIGVKISTEYDSDYLKSIGYPAGAVVESVDSNSPADQIGIKAYDIITQVNGVSVTSSAQYNTERLKHSPGETITLQVYRQGRYYDVKLTLGESIS